MDCMGVEVDEQEQRRNNAISSRLYAFMFSITAAILMMTNKESTVVDGINLKMKFNYSSALQFFAWTNLSAAIYTIIVWLVLYLLNRKGRDPPIDYYNLFIFDLMMSLVLGAGVTAEATFLSIAQDGSSRVGWFGICDHFEGFCLRLKVSVFLGMGSFLCYLGCAVLGFAHNRNSNTRINPI